MRILTLLLAGSLLTQTQPPAAAPDQPIRNFLKVSTDFCTGGQPRPEHFAQLKADGVKAVLNLRTPGEHRADEENAAAEQPGLTSFHIPGVHTAPSAAEAGEFLGSPR